MAASGHQTFLRLRYIVALQPEGELGLNGIVLFHSQHTEGNVQLLIAVSNGGRVSITRFRQETAPQHLIGLSIVGFFCCLKFSFGLSGHPAHGLSFKPHHIPGAFHHKLIIDRPGFIGGVRASRTHLCFESRRVGHYVKGAHRIVQWAAVVSGAVIIIPGRSAGADRQFRLRFFIFHQISVRNIGEVSIQLFTDLARGINRESELFRRKNCFRFLSFLCVFQFHIGLIGHGKGNIFI